MKEFITPARGAIKSTVSTKVSRSLAIATITAALGAVACDRPLPASAHPDMLAGEFVDEFWIGDQDREHQFADISSLAFTPVGNLVVVDSDDYAVSVFDAGGRKVAGWGSRGQGPGEFSRPPGQMAVSGDGAIAIDTNSGRVDVFNAAGKLVNSHRLDGLAVTGVAFDREGNVLVRTTSPSLAALATSEPVPTQIMRLADLKVLWSSRPLPSVTSLQLHAPQGILADIGEGLIAVGISDTYDFALLDTSTGENVGRLARDVSLRGPTEEFVIRFKEGLDRDRFRRISIDDITFASTFPVTSRIFRGPPGRTLWVYRHWGIDDELAPSVRELEDGALRLYDLFSSDNYQYLGTVRAPNRLELMVGDSTRVAGVYTSELNEQSVRVMRFSLPPGGRR